jgi:hypothetical protein
VPMHRMPSRSPHQPGGTATPIGDCRYCEAGAWQCGGTRRPGWYHEGAQAQLTTGIHRAPIVTGADRRDEHSELR